MIYLNVTVIVQRLLFFSNVQLFQKQIVRQLQCWFTIALGLEIQGGVSVWSLCQRIKLCNVYFVSPNLNKSCQVSRWEPHPLTWTPTARFEKWHDKEKSLCNSPSFERPMNLSLCRETGTGVEQRSCLRLRYIHFSWPEMQSLLPAV